MEYYGYLTVLIILHFILRTRLTQQEMDQFQTHLPSSITVFIDNLTLVGRVRGTNPGLRLADHSFQSMIYGNSLDNFDRISLLFSKLSGSRDTRMMISHMPASPLMPN